MSVRKVTATVADPLALPPYLKRKPDNTLADPKPWGKLVPLKVVTLPPREDLSKWTDERLHHALSDIELKVADRQPVYQELAKREKRAKTYEKLRAAGFVHERKPVVPVPARTEVPEDYERQWT